jgi:sugar phosphate permease
MHPPRLALGGRRRGHRCARRRLDLTTTHAAPGARPDPFADVLQNRTVLILIAVFSGANFVAAIVLTWMPTFLHHKFQMDLAWAGFSGTAYFQVGSVLGVLLGGALGDRLAHRHAGGRMMTQAFGLFLGVPFIFLTGWTLLVSVLILAMVGFGFFKGFYDANLWSSLYDVVALDRRATALGLMNAVGWLGGAAAPVTIALAAEAVGMSAALSANCLIYFGLGCLLCYGICRSSALSNSLIRYQLLMLPAPAASASSPYSPE